jgi:2-phospho-L-lactate guanylyltransferase|tara:strand:- start:446 stop:1069 length:624 start_codon:yes stop_codon:yes gene_type:complete
MRTFALLTLNRTDEAKSRLASILSPDERKQLVILMAKDILDSLVEIDTIIISREDLKSEFKEYKHEFILQRDKGLTNAVETANIAAIKKGADATIFLPGDVPLINKKIIKNIISYGEDHKLIISPGKRNGIGMVYRRPPDIIKTVFTNQSFVDILHKTSNTEENVFIYSCPNLYTDIDIPADIKDFLKMGKGKRTFEYLSSKLEKIL